MGTHLLTTLYRKGPQESTESKGNHIRTKSVRRASALPEKNPTSFLLPKQRQKQESWWFRVCRLLNSPVSLQGRGLSGREVGGCGGLSVDSGLMMLIWPDTRAMRESPPTTASPQASACACVRVPGVQDPLCQTSRLSASSEYFPHPHISPVWGR